MTPEQQARLQRIVSALAHQCLSRLLRRHEQTDVEITGRAFDDDTCQQVVIHFRPNRPGSIDPNPLADLVRYEPHLTPTQWQIVNACQPDAPLTAKQIARKTRRSYSSYLRGLLAELVQLGFLKKTRAGYVSARSSP